jgi:DNA (cytosine-5)-methyltransferase 1
MTLTFGSLFAGVGGFDMGFEQAGWDCKFQVEWDKNCQQILNKHWPDVPKWLDVSDVNGAEIPPVDCIIFGSPCQDLSVAGKRAGLEGERSGLFHEAVRIIKEMRDATNGTFPRWTVWENVAGALSSNNGRDFATVINEMAKAGACLQEYALLDAQHFGVPQRRRRVFLVSCFDSATASICPSPLLPVGESLRGDTKKGKPKRKSATIETSTGFGSGSFGGWTETDTAITLSARDHKGGNTIAVEGYTSSSFAQYQEGVGTLRSNGGDLGGGSETLIAEPYVKSRRAQSATDNETWVPGEVNPTLNSFDVGDTRATTAIVEEPMLVDGTRVDDVRVYEPPVQTLGARMGTGGNNVPMLAFDTQFGSNANVFEDQSPTLKSSQAAPSVAYPIDTRNALRDPEKHDAQNRQGLGIGNDGDPMATLTSTHVNAVVYGITGNAIGRQDHNGPNGPSHTPENGPMFTLTSTDIHAVAYDEYNDSINKVHHALRVGTKQSTGVLLENDVVGTLRSGGSGGVPSSRGEHLVTEPIMSPTLTAYNMDSRSPQSEEQQRIVNAVFESTMAVRRLTPLECERLMGWPDDHTRFKADGTEQADTHRYKQCGNGVASPVAKWVAEHIAKVEHGEG